jgi:hypothetical protein
MSPVKQNFSLGDERGVVVVRAVWGGAVDGPRCHCGLVSGRSLNGAGSREGQAAQKGEGEWAQHALTTCCAATGSESA